MNEVTMPIVFPTAQATAVDIPNCQLVPIMAGWMAALPDGLGQWEVFRQVTLARAMATARRFGPDTYLTGLATAAVYGAKSWIRAPDIDLVTPRSRQQSSVDLPAVNYKTPDGSVMQVKKASLNRVSRVAPGTSEVVTVQGLQVAAIPEAMIEVAKHARPFDALAVADSLARIYCQASRFKREWSLDNEDMLRTQVNNLLDAQPGARGVARARGTLAHFSCLAESPGESAMRWTLLTHGIRDFILQPRIRVSDQDYYPDIFINVPTVASEYEGMSKYDDPETGRHEAQRKIDLSRQGVQVVHMDGRDLHDQQKYLGNLMQVFNAKGYSPELKPALELLDPRPRLRRAS